MVRNDLPTLIVHGSIVAEDLVVHDPDGLACNIRVITQEGYNHPSMEVKGVLRIQGDITLYASKIDYSSGTTIGTSKTR